jgi:hypothetical protein
MEATNKVIENLQQEITNLQAQMQAAPPGVLTIPLFALSPAELAMNTFINYSTLDRAKIFKSTMDGLLSLI